MPLDPDDLLLTLSREAMIKLLADVREVLYPGGDRDHEWEVDTIERVAVLIEPYVLPEDEQLERMRVEQAAADWDRDAQEARSAMADDPFGDLDDPRNNDGGM